MKGIAGLALVELHNEAKEIPKHPFSYMLNNESDCFTLEVMEETPENLSKAKEWLASHKSTADLIGGHYYRLTFYAIEYCSLDEDGEILAGGDYDYSDLELPEGEEEEEDEEDW